MKGSLLVEVHAWRGFRTVRDLFAIGVVAGYVTLYVSRQSIADSIREMKARLDKARDMIGGKK